MWVLRPERAVMFSGGLEGVYVGAPTLSITLGSLYDCYSKAMSILIFMWK